MPRVLDPLHHVAVHVVKAEGIGGFLPDRLRLAIGFASVPGQLIKLDFLVVVSQQIVLLATILYTDTKISAKIERLDNKLVNHMADHLYRPINLPINWDLVENDIKDIPYDPGIYIPIDLDLLIDEVYVAPGSPDWFLQVVESVCRQFALNLRWAQVQVMAERRRSIVRTAFGFLPGAGGSDADAAR
jgi:hypothetical protein